MIQPPLDLTPVSTTTSDAKILPLDFTHVGAKPSEPKTLTLSTESSKLKAKS